MDKYIVDEMDKDYAYILSKVKDKVVMDIGANLGAFTKYSLLNGAKRVIAIEPELDNYTLLLLNSTDDVIPINAAVSMVSDEEVTLYVNSGNNKGLHTIMPDWLCSSRPDCTIQTISTISIQYLLETYRPEVLKIDIEGGETIIAEVIKNLPDYVKYVAIEFDTISDTYLATIHGLLDSRFKDAQRNKFFTGSRDD